MEEVFLPGIVLDKPEPFVNSQRANLACHLRPPVPSSRRTVRLAIARRRPSHRRLLPSSFMWRDAAPRPRFYRRPPRQLIGIRPDRSSWAGALFVAKFQVFFKWSTDPATARLRALSGVFHCRLTSRAVEGNHLFWRFFGQAPREAIANLTGHLDRTNARSLHTLSLPSAREC